MSWLSRLLTPAPPRQKGEVGYVNDEGDVYHGGGLWRLHDPKPDFWLADFTQIMESRDWYGFEPFGPCYGNFWAADVCTNKAHNWAVLRMDTEAPEFPRAIYRCQLCGSQCHVLLGRTPVRGKL